MYNGQKSNNSAGLFGAFTAQPKVPDLDSDRYAEQFAFLMSTIEKLNGASPNPSNEAGIESISQLQDGMKNLKTPSARPVVTPQSNVPLNRAGFMTHATSVPGNPTQVKAPSAGVVHAKVPSPRLG